MHRRRPGLHRGSGLPRRLCGRFQLAADGKLQVATTVAPITSIAASIGGDRVKVTGIVPEGTNSHTFEPKPSDAELLSRADVVDVNGLKLEDPTVDLARQSLKKGADIVEVGTRSIPASRYIYDFSFPRAGESRTRTSGPIPGTRLITRA